MCATGHKGRALGRCRAVQSFLAHLGAVWEHQVCAVCYCACVFVYGVQCIQVLVCLQKGFVRHAMLMDHFAVCFCHVHCVSEQFQCVWLFIVVCARNHVTAPLLLGVVFK